MTFGDAANHLEAGRIITREGWNDASKVVICLQKPGDELWGEPADSHVFSLVSHDNSAFTHEDLTADDWRVIEVH